jgi:hypothetical protein
MSNNKVEISMSRIELYEDVNNWAYCEFKNLATNCGRIRLFRKIRYVSSCNYKYSTIIAWFGNITQQYCQRV